MDVLCQAKSGMGKTAVFVLATLQQIEPVDGEVAVIVLCHTRELAYQIKNEYARFSKFMPELRTSVFYGGTSIKNDIEVLKSKDKCPHIVVGTPGRLNALVRDKALNGATVKHFVLDECDKLLEQLGQFMFLLLLPSRLWRPLPLPVLPPISCCCRITESRPLPASQLSTASPNAIASFTEGRALCSIIKHDGSLQLSRSTSAASGLRSPAPVQEFCLRAASFQLSLGLGRLALAQG